MNNNDYCAKSNSIKYKPNNTASIEKDAYCDNCGWPIIFVCCNNEMRNLYPTEDYWMYCSNKGCESHIGEPYGQHHKPSFLKRITLGK